MYSITHAGDRTIQAFSVPPRPPEGMDPEMAALGEFQWMLHDAGGVENLAGVVRAADDAQIDLARPHLSYVLKEIKEAMISRYLEITSGTLQPALLSKDCLTAHDVVGRAISKVTKDCNNALDACITMPGNDRRLRMLAEVVRTLAEAATVTEHIALRTGDDRDLEFASQAKTAWAAVNQRIEDFRRDVGKLYRVTVDAVLGQPGELEAAGRARAAATVGPLPELTERRLNKAEMHLPYYMDYYKGQGPRQMRPQEAEPIRKGVASVLEDFAETFHKPGFVRALRAAAVVAQWHAEKSLDRALDRQTDESKARTWADKEDKRHSRDGYGYDQWLSFHQGWRARDGREGVQDTSRAASLRGWLQEATRALRPDLPDVRTLEFSLDEVTGALVGRFRQPIPGDRTIIIHDDAGCGGYPGAVHVSAFRDGVIGNDIPTLVQVRDLADQQSQQEILGTSNYRSFHDALAELSNEFDQGYFGGCRFEIADVASVPPPRAARDMPELESAAPRL